MKLTEEELTQKIAKLEEAARNAQRVLEEVVQVFDFTYSETMIREDSVTAIILLGEAIEVQA